MDAAPNHSTLSRARRLIDVDLSASGRRQQVHAGSERPVPGRVRGPQAIELRQGVRKQVHTHRKAERQVVADPFAERLVGGGEREAYVDVAAGRRRPARARAEPDDAPHLGPPDPDPPRPAAHGPLNRRFVVRLDHERTG